MTCAVLGRESSTPTFGRPVHPPHGAAPIGPRAARGVLRGEAGVGSGHPPRDRRPPPEYVWHPARWRHCRAVRPGRGRAVPIGQWPVTGGTVLADMVLHYLAPARVAVEARCTVMERGPTAPWSEWPCTNRRARPHGRSGIGHRAAGLTRHELAVSPRPPRGGHWPIPRRPGHTSPRATTLPAPPRRVDSPSRGSRPAGPEGRAGSTVMTVSCRGTVLVCVTTRAGEPSGAEVPGRHDALVRADTAIVSVVPPAEPDAAGARRPRWVRNQFHGHDTVITGSPLDHRDPAGRDPRPTVSSTRPWGRR